ncbi:Protein of uncharacterised function (DUF1342) [Chromobacterium violaceum]|uniref:Protein of uncharacterized function (DUF1342) n=1 Tax=Chromobacterium violaceum TaxID=536 RepID=A0A3S4J4Q1_CHRVL|nr:Protein of uncharacterised function (DUF1342) [Chromobacterium violaceum]
MARKGAFQQMSGGKVVQLIQVAYDDNLELLPELSANNMRSTSASSAR